MNNEQLRARLFTLSAARGPKWGLDFTEDIMSRYEEGYAIKGTFGSYVRTADELKKVEK